MEDSESSALPLGYRAILDEFASLLYNKPVIYQARNGQHLKVVQVNLKQYIKKFELPEGFVAPSKLEFEDLAAWPLTRQDLAADLAGVNTSIETIQKTRGGSWPTEPLS